MLDSPLVSILIPVYNRQTLIGECIESALLQTIKNIEIVVCDNCSSDGTWSVLEEYAQRDTRIRIFRNERNLGPVGNWHRCAMEARAPYAKILFSDDVIDSTFLERTLPLIQKPNVGAVFVAARIGETPSLCTTHYIFPGLPGIWRKGAYAYGVVHGYDLPVSPCAGLFHTADMRDIFLLHGPAPLLEQYKRTGAGPDLLMFLEAEARHGCVAHVPESLVFFRSHKGSISISQNDVIGRLYDSSVLWFTRNFAPELYPRYVARICFLVRRKSGNVQARTEIAEILKECELADQPIPRGLVYLTLLLNHLWSKRAAKKLKEGSR